MTNDDACGDLDQFVMRAGLAHGGALSDAARNALYADALQFFQAGGVLSTQDWSNMAASTRKVYADAHLSYEGERLGVLIRLLGVRVPRARKNPTAPENRAAWEERLADELEEETSADEAEQRAISEALDAHLAGASR